MKKHLSTILLFLILIVGVGVLLYPTVSDYWNNFHQSRAIASYVEQVAQIDTAVYDREWQKALAYNVRLNWSADRWTMTEKKLQEYNSVLNLTGSGIMGYIEIPKINCSLPIYHGTDESVLQIAVGHIEGTSLPTGGAGTHTVLSGHRGLPSARLFTDLDQMEPDDLFVIRVMDRVMTYMVDQILIVLPEEMDALSIDPNDDYCTLVTCTPYGINSHRLLVRGHRTDNVEMEQIIKVVSDATQIKPILVAPVLAAPMLVILLVWMMVSTGRKQRRRKIIK
jgi:sortase A